MAWELTFAAYDGPHRVFAVSDAGERVGFETLAEAQMFIAEMNDTPEWQEYCRTAVEGE